MPTQTQEKFHSGTSYTDQNKLATISQALCDNATEIFEKFGIELCDGKSHLYGPCPIHGGDRFNAFVVYPSGFWTCHTHGCQNTFKSSAIGMIRGILSHQQLGWAKPGDTVLSWSKTVEACLKLLKKDYSEIQAKAVANERANFAQTVEMLAKPEPKKNEITREIVRKSLQIPAQYYIDRGFSKEVLDEYDVGFCSNPKREMYNRVVVPVYDEFGTFIGCTGRSIHPLCEKCRLYHAKDRLQCPDKKQGYYFAKWKHNYGFRTQENLYNYAKAKPYIATLNAVVLVESPGNVWKLVENHIHNCVAVFGATLNEGQKALLDATGALSIIVIGDNDDGGEALCRDVQKKCQRTYRLYFPKLKDKNDIADLSKDEITNDIKPMLENIERII